MRMRGPTKGEDPIVPLKPESNQAWAKNPAIATSATIAPRPSRHHAMTRPANMAMRRSIYR
jgi:hypothetical protein